MNGYKCEYHPSKEAVGKCERCGKMICLRCKMNYQQPHSQSSGVGEHHHVHTYYTSHEYCPICYYDAVAEANTGKGAQMGIICLT